MGELAKELEEINEKYELKEILSLNLKNKSAALLFKEKNGEKNCVMYIEKKYISESEIKNMVVCIKDTKLTFTNGPFFNFECCFDVPDLYTSTLIKPATDGMINKYRFSELYLFEETYEEYRKICLPYFLSQIHNNQWVHNILDGKTEQNRVLFKNDDFLVAADLKWDMKDMDKIYLLVILTRRDVYSLRQLDSSFLEILKTISLTCKSIMFKNFGVEETRIKMFVHYYPTYFHFHIHVNLLSLENDGAVLGKAHYLDNIIENIKLVSDYYQKIKLTVTIPKHFKLYNLLCSADIQQNSDK